MNSMPSLKARNTLSLTLVVPNALYIQIKPWLAPGFGYELMFFSRTVFIHLTALTVPQPSNINRCPDSCFKTSRQAFALSTLSVCMAVWRRSNSSSTSMRNNMSLSSPSRERNISSISSAVGAGSFERLHVA